MHVFSSYSSAGLGIGSLGSRIGGICAPLLLLLGSLWQPLPQIVFGATSVIAGLLVIPLPETKGQPLPQTTKEAESLGWYVNLRCLHVVICIDIITYLNTAILEGTHHYWLYKEGDRGTVG